jgi:hypothetical protein
MIATKVQRPAREQISYRRFLQCFVPFERIGFRHGRCWA